MSRSRVWRLEARNGKLRVTEYGNRREHRPRGGPRAPRELARSGRGALAPNRRPSSRRASPRSTKEQGRYWHDTAAPPSCGVARGGVLRRTQRTTQWPRATQHPAELGVGCALLMALFGGTYERAGRGPTSTPGNWVEPPCWSTSGSPTPEWHYGSSGAWQLAPSPWTMNLLAHICHFLHSEPSHHQAGPGCGIWRCMLT